MMASSHERGQIRSNDMTTNSLSAPDVRSCTVTDIATLAGVSTATVSRVVNGSGTVSHEAKGKVLSAISGLRYCPNNHAAELGRQNRGVPRKWTVSVNASSATAAALSRRSKAEQLHHLQDENTRLRRQLADLTLQLETLKRLVE